MASNAKKVFVLGYTGKTGKAVVEALVKDTDFGIVKLIGRRQADISYVAGDTRFVSI